MILKINNLTASLLMVLAFMFFLPFPCSCGPDQKISTDSEQIMPGIKFSCLIRPSSTGSLRVNILKIDLKNEKINMRPCLAKGVIGNLERTSSIAERNNAVAAVNGSFFETRNKLHLPVGFMIINGQIVNRSILQRTTIGITKDKQIIFGIPKIKGYVINLSNRKSVKIWGINRPRKNNEAVIYTREYGENTGTDQSGIEIAVKSDGTIRKISFGNSRIPRDGFVLSLQGWPADFALKTKNSDKIGLVYDLSEKWKDVEQAITAGPLLVKDGEIQKESIASENFNNKMLAPTSRTAIGVSKDNELILVVVDGKQSSKEISGATFDEMAGIMKDAGAVGAIGLDGGHTSTMYLNGKIVNAPLMKDEGRVSNAIVITYDGWETPIALQPGPSGYVYAPPDEEMIEALKNDANMAPSSYVPRPEDFGMFGMDDTYNRMIRPFIPR